MENFLTLARERVEEFLGYPIYPRFVCDERHLWNRSGVVGPMRWGYVQKIGAKTTEEIDTVPTDLTEDVFEFDYTVDFTDACEARIFHTAPNGGEEITPLSKSISGTTLTVRLAKCTLVVPDIIVPKECLNYDDDENFVEDIVLKRVYAQPGTGSDLIWRPNISSCASCSPCVEQSQAACPTIRDKRGGEVYVNPAVYADNAWTSRSLSAFANCGRYPMYSELDYVAYYDEDCDGGCEQIPSHIKLAILHVALADMPRQPICACTFHKQMFAEDQTLPTKFDSREFSPFGIKFGHLTAYKMLQMSTIGQGGQLVAI